MKYLSLDIETTGLSFNCDILEIGCIVEDTKKKLPYNELPKYRALFKHSQITGELFALKINSKLIEELCSNSEDCDIFQDYKDFGTNFRRFLLDNFGANKIVLAGKNVSGFDLPFMKAKLAGCCTNNYFSHRIIDVGSLYIDWNKDLEIPNLKECKNRANLTGEVSHTSLGDAFDVIQLLRKFY